MCRMRNSKHLQQRIDYYWDILLLRFLGFIQQRKLQSLINRHDREVLIVFLIIDHLPSLLTPQDRQEPK